MSRINAQFGLGEANYHIRVGIPSQMTKKKSMPSSAVPSQESLMVARK